MKMWYFENNSSLSYNFYTNTSKREYHIYRELSYDYDTENYGFADSRETIERRINHRSFSVDFLLDM